jgi:hypothetical protein
LIGQERVGFVTLAANHTPCRMAIPGSWLVFVTT